MTGTAVDGVLARMRTSADPTRLDGMARYGIGTTFLADVARSADDDRPVVRKAASWALRQIGKRNQVLHARAVATAKELAAARGRGARWVGRDALRELESARVRERLQRSATGGG